MLVGRDLDRLDEVAAGIGGRVEVVRCRSLEEMTDAIARRRPRVVLNTIGPFSQTALPVARACLPDGHYVDLANDVDTVRAVLELSAEAAGRGSVLITGAGFGFVATEAVVAALCEGLGSAAAVRVDAIPSLALEAGPLGEALARTIVEGLPAGGRTYRGGALVRSGLGAKSKRLTTPDGDQVQTAAAPLGDLHAARLLSGASDVLAASSEVPAGVAVRVAAAVGGPLVRVRVVRELIVRRLAAVELKARARPRTSSWGHAEVRWPDGGVRTGWLRAPEAMEFTVAVASEVASRLLEGEGRPGAWTPIGAFGADLASAAGGELLLR